MQQPLKSSSRAGNGCLIAFGLVWTAFSLLWTLAALKAGPMALCGLPFVAIGFAMLYGGFQPWIVGMKLGTPDVSLSRGSLCVGDTFTFRFSQAVRKPVEITKVSVHLLFRESATYQRGTDTVTDVFDTPVEAYEHPGRRYEAGETISEELNWRIHGDAMHTFSSSNNKLQWLIRLHVEIASWPDLKEDYDLIVEPRIAG